MNKRMLGSGPPTTLDTIVSLQLLGYKSGLRHRTRRTWFRRRRARLHFRRAHYVSNSDFRANFEIGRTFCRGRIDINFEFLRVLLHSHHAARGGYHPPSDLITLRASGECYPTEDQIRYRDQAKCHFHFHAVNYESPQARRKILGDIDLRTRASFRFNDVTLLRIQRDVSHSFGGSGIVLIPTRARYSSACSKSVPARSMILSKLSIDETSSSCSVRNHCKKLIVM
jgi:hypothetical protein